MAQVFPNQWCVERARSFLEIVAVPVLDDCFIHILVQFFGTNLPVLLGCPEECLYSPSTFSCSFSLQRQRKLDICGCELGSFICTPTRSLGGVFCDHNTWDSYLAVMPVLASLSNNSNNYLPALPADVTVLDAAEEKHRAVQEPKKSSRYDRRCCETHAFVSYRTSSYADTLITFLW